MATFAYRGRASGGAVTGEIDADNRLGAVALLRGKGIIATAVAMMPRPRSSATAPRRFSASISPFTAPAPAHPRYANVAIS